MHRLYDRNRRNVYLIARVDDALSPIARIHALGHRVAAILQALKKQTDVH